MARAILSYPFRNTSNILTANTSDRFELFRTATYATSAQSSSVSLAVAERGGISNGDTLYVGTNSAVTVTAGGGNTGAGTLTIDTSISWSNNDSVVVKRKTGGGSDAYATVYDDPDFATSYPGGQPITVNSDNEVRFFVPPGRYGVRWSNSSGTTLDLDHDVTFDGEDVVQVPILHDSATSGIQEALSKLTSRGGKVILNAGDYAITTGITMTTIQRIVGAGPQATTLTLGADITGITISNDVAGRQRVGHLADLTVQQKSVVNTGQLVAASSTNGLQFERVIFNANDLVNTGDAVQLTGCVATTFIDCHVGDNTATPTGSFANGVELDNCDATTFINMRFSDCTDGIDVTDGSGASGGITLISPDFNSVTNAIRLNTGAGANNLTVVGPAFTSVTNRIVFVGANTSSKNVFYAGYQSGTASTYWDTLLIQPPTVQAVTTSATTIVTNSRNTILLTSDADYTLTNAPTIADGTDGQELVLINGEKLSAETSALTLQDKGTLASSNISLKTSTVKLRAGDSIRLRWYTTSGNWEEIERSAPPSTGTATISTSATNVTVTHGMTATPTADQIHVVPTNKPTNDPGWVYIDTITSSQFNINVYTSPGASTATFAWRVDPA